MTTKELQQRARDELRCYDPESKYHRYLLNNILPPAERATFLAARGNPGHDRYFKPAAKPTWRDRLAGRTPATVPTPEPLTGMDKLFGSRSRFQETKDPYAAAAKLVMSRPVEPERTTERPIEDAPELRTSRFQEQAKPNPENAWLFGEGPKPAAPSAAVKPSAEFDHLFGVK